jgi:branched-chain amino acid transport system substrate-binding protein
MSDPRDNPSEGLKPVTRRRFMRRTAAVGATIGAGGLLAACGDDNKSSGSTGSSSTAKATTAAAATGVGAQLQKILGKPTNILAKGPGTLEVAGQFALTGQGSVYGDLQSNGWKYGVKHVEAWTGGKLKFDTTFYDNKSGLPQAEAAAGRQAGLKGVPVLVNSYIFGFGAIVPFAKQYKMFCPDPGGGTGPVPGPFAAQPYCYGFRAGWPTDCLDGLFKYLRETYPEKKNWATVQVNIAPPYNNSVQSYMKGLFKTYNINNLGFTLAPIGATNYSSVIQKVKQQKPDVVIFITFGTDVAYQAKEMVRQGVDAIKATADFNPTLAKLAGPALKDWYFGFDYLNTSNPPSDWSKFFIDQWGTDHSGELPSFYHAGDYVTAFAVAQLVDRILAKGGDIKSGDAYVTALEENPSFPHVYGGSGSTLGQIVIDAKTHGPKAIPMLAFQSMGTGDVKDIKPLATYDIKAADYKTI